MTPLLALIAMSPALDGEAAVEVARKFLMQMGVTHITGLNTVIQRDDQKNGEKFKSWIVGLDLSGGGFFSVSMTTAGTVYYASGQTKSAGRPPAPKDAEKIAWRLMNRVPKAIPVKLDSIGSNDAGPCAATFRAIVNGRTFFNMNPTYGYHLMFDANGQLTWFGREDTLPKTADRVARISRTKAEKDLFNLYNGSRPTSWPYPRHVEAELGYYKLKDEPKARLVWHGQVFSTMQGRNSQFATIDTMVDAVTGDMVKADDR